MGEFLCGQMVIRTRREPRSSETLNDQDRDLATIEPGPCYDQMYSSAMAPSLHLATVTIRASLANSPTTHVH